jgi:predicted PurR-regulated permease PerM
LITFTLLIAIPLVLVISSAISQANNLVRGLDFESMGVSIQEVVVGFESLVQQIGAEGVSFDGAKLAAGVREALGTVINWLGEVVISLGQSIPNFFLTVMVVLVIVVVLLPRYKLPGRQDLLAIVPFPPEITQLFLDKAELMIIAMFKGTFVLAVIEGAAMGVVLWIAGVPYVTFLTITSMVLSLIPFIGVSLVAWPIGIGLLIAGNTWQGAFVILGFILIVANLDTILRPSLVPKGAYLNPALVILSVFGGLSLMGLIGALYGPVVMILLVTSVEVYTKFMLRSDLERLDQAGHIDLVALGLVDEPGDEESANVIVSTLKAIAGRIRRGPAGQSEDETLAGEADERPQDLPED